MDQARVYPDLTQEELRILEKIRGRLWPEWRLAMVSGLNQLLWYPMTWDTVEEEIAYSSILRRGDQREMPSI